MKYLEAVLFPVPGRPQQPVIDSALGDSIIHHYFTFAPAKLATLILNSCLTDYDREDVVKLLEQMQRTMEASGGHMVPKNIFARAVLYLEMDDIGAAMKDVLSLDPEILMEFGVTYPQLLQGTTSTSCVLLVIDIRVLCVVVCVCECAVCVVCVVRECR